MTKEHCNPALPSSWFGSCEYENGSYESEALWTFIGRGTPRQRLGKPSAALPPHFREVKRQRIAAKASWSFPTDSENLVTALALIPMLEFGRDSIWLRNR